MEWNGIESNGIEWNGIERNRIEWNGIRNKKVLVHTHTRARNSYLIFTRMRTATGSGRRTSR